MLRHFERLGGEVRLHDPVMRIDTLGAKATGVTTQSGWSGAFAAVASNADLVHTYRDLLARHPAGRTMAKRLARSASAPRCSSSTSGSKAAGRAFPIT
jgi:phytoene desaturase